MRLPLLALIVAMCGWAAPAVAFTITNPGFEDGSTGTAVVIPGWTTIDTPDMVAPGGLSIGSPTDFTLALGMTASPDAGQFALLRNSPLTFGPEGVSQAISGLTPSVTYTVSFLQANGGSRDFRVGQPDQTGPGHWDVTFAGVTQSAPTMTFDGFGSQTWGLVSLDFVATSSTEVLLFSARGFVGGGLANTGRLALDGITIVPEPSTALLVGLGLAALGVRRRASETA